MRNGQSLGDGGSRLEGLPFFFNPHNWPLFYYTAKNMQPRQLAGIVERKVRHAIIPPLPIDFDQRYTHQIPPNLEPNIDPVAKNLNKLRQSLSRSERRQYRTLADAASDGCYTFLNRTIQFDDGINWDHELLNEYPLLWRLKLQSFEHLEWLVLGYDCPSSAVVFEPSLENQIFSWIRENPIGEREYLRRSWIPHSVSLRILNWCRYAAWCSHDNTRSVSDELYHAIYKNSLFLSNHIEFEIGGNHLIENAIALVMAGVLFENHNTGWTEKGYNLLRQASEMQFLADGGHFERSPMYHTMVLQRYLTACNLLSNTDLDIRQLKKTAEKALGFLLAISEPSGRFPLLNDSVHGEQIEAKSCFRYGHRCSVSPGEISINHPDGSGYHMLKRNESTLLIDTGKVGPPQLPAHSHNDQLSILFWVKENPVLTDTGVYDYAPNSYRQYTRSVRAHNTVQYSDTEPIPIGGRYLMGQRNSPEIFKENDSQILAQYERKTLTGYVYKHKRKVIQTQSGWKIFDEVTSQNDEPYSVRYHFDPSIQVKRKDDDSTFDLYKNDEKLVNFQFKHDGVLQISESPYFIRYGESKSRTVISITSELSNNISTCISIL